MNSWLKSSSSRGINKSLNYSSVGSSINSSLPSLPIITQSHRKQQDLDSEIETIVSQFEEDTRQIKQEMESFNPPFDKKGYLQKSFKQIRGKKNIFKKVYATNRISDSMGTSQNKNKSSSNENSNKQVRFLLPTPDSYQKKPVSRVYDYEQSLSFELKQKQLKNNVIVQKKRYKRQIKQNNNISARYLPKSPLQVSYGERSIDNSLTPQNIRSNRKRKQSSDEEQDNYKYNQRMSVPSSSQQAKHQIRGSSYSRNQILSIKNNRRSSFNQVEQNNTGMRSKRSTQNRMGSLGRTTGRKQGIREHIISLIEYCSNQVGMAMYNTNSGEIYLTQIIQRLTYFRTISTIERYYPLEIVYSASLENTRLVKRVMNKYKNTSFRPLKREFFDQTKGFSIYNMRGNKGEYNLNNKFIAYSALSALIYYLQNNYDSKFTYSSLKIKWHLLDQIMVLESQAVFDLEIFLNSETKQKVNSFVSNFVCLTEGGNRMLRANLLQPSSNQKVIKDRQDLVECLLRDKILFDILSNEIVKFKHFEILTAKFIQSPKQQNLKSLKNYLSAIYSLSHECLLLKKLYQKIEDYQNKQIKLIDNLIKAINHIKVKQLRDSIQNNFDEEILKNYNQNKGKRDNFIFLFKTDKIDDEFVEIIRITYSHTLQDILRIFKQIKQSCKQELKLIYNQARGYYIKCKKKIDLNQLSLAIQDDIIQITERKDVITFSTSILSSLNNRLKESQKKLVLQSQTLLRQIIADIQKNIDVLFDINSEISNIDMVMSFVKFIQTYHSVNFTRPIIQKGSNIFRAIGFKSVWINERVYKLSDEIDIEINSNNSILIYQKAANSFRQLSILYSIGYLTILAQIGCYVPAKEFVTDLYDTLISKMLINQNIQLSLSHFQSQVNVFKNMLDNCCNPNQKSIILVDQLVKGTHYEEQVSLSLAVLNKLARLKGKSVLLISDHFQLKMIDKISKNPSLFYNIKKQEENNGLKPQLNNNFLPSISIIYAPISKLSDSIQMKNLDFDSEFILNFNKKLDKSEKRQRQ